MNNYKYLDKIVIEATKEWPKPPIIDRETNNNYDFWLDAPPLLASAISKVNISDIDLSQWKVTMHYEYVERFKKVADIVGNKKAEEVLRALDS